VSETLATLKLILRMNLQITFHISDKIIIMNFIYSI